MFPDPAMRPFSTPGQRRAPVGDRLGDSGGNPYTGRPGASRPLLRPARSWVRARSKGAWRNWQRSGLQNRRLQVRVLSPLRRWHHRLCRAYPNREGEVATRKRRDEDAVDKRLDQEPDEALDEAAEDEGALDDEFEEDEADEEPAGRRRRGGTAVKRAKADAESDTMSKAKTKSGKAKEKAKEKRPERVGPLGRLIRFIREVVAELRKVIWPTRKELVTYTVVVVFFVIVMLSIIAAFDFGFAKAMLWVFGSHTAK